MPMTPVTLKTPNHYRVLLIEDEPAIRDIYATKLRMEGFDVVEAKDGLEGLDKAVHDGADVVLLDVLMPVKDGFETLADLKANPRSRAIPVVMLTNMNQDFEVKKGLQLGAESYLVKANVSLAHVITEVHDILKKHGKE